MGTWGNKGAPKDSGVERDWYGNPHAVTYETTTMEQDALKTRGIFPKPEEVRAIVVEQEPVGVHVDAKPVTETEYDTGDDGKEPDPPPPPPETPTISAISPTSATVGD